MYYITCKYFEIPWSFLGQNFNVTSIQFCLSYIIQNVVCLQMKSSFFLVQVPYSVPRVREVKRLPQHVTWSTSNME
jgi:hypothetical protein